jgi:ubiquinone/menaquinone biosynthesis C-methylase UbiE
VLDLGSGAGIDVFLAAQQVGESGRVIGIDMTPEMLQRARENAANHGIENVEFRQGDIEAMPVDDASVDVVISNCVINLVPDKRSVYSEIQRVLRPGGRFIVSDMVTYGTMPAAVKKDLELWAGCVAGALDRQEYLSIIAEAGFERVSVKSESTYDSPDKSTFGLQSVTLEGWKQS